MGEEKHGGTKYHLVAAILSLILALWSLTGYVSYVKILKARLV